MYLRLTLSPSASPSYVLMLTEATLAKKIYKGVVLNFNKLLKRSSAKQSTM